MIDLLDPAMRRVVSTADTDFRSYDRYGKLVPDLEWLPLSGEAGNDEYECFLIRFKPGASSSPHEHTGTEEFMVLEGELEDADGTVFKTGDFVSYQPGSRHYSVSPKGCVLLVNLRGRNRPLDAA